MEMIRMGGYQKTWHALENVICCWAVSFWIKMLGKLNLLEVVGYTTHGMKEVMQTGSEKMLNDWAPVCLVHFRFEKKGM